ncbi:permease-like cell division protein FtsX [Neoactinobaculum massilliense]|uniref:permease-like cell division protein FtsX n=1 Tax=Neoactinobaculum massilliense TaxID=2364794 RepID=UPI000F536E91|nr:permease-like cell division protein FtsX [Neoactinobaculum massilliense]
MRFQFVLSQTFQGLWRNKAMAAAVALVTFVCLYFIGAAALLQAQIGNLKDEWYDKVEVSAFMCPSNSSSAQCAGGEATQEQIDAISGYLKSDEMQQYIQSVSFETKEEALKNYQEQMKDTAWAQDLTADQMQVSFRIKLKDPSQYQIVADALSGRPGVETVNDQREVLQPIFSIMQRFTLLSGVLAGIMVITALLLIPTTIRLSAMSRRTETGIMRFVGASNAFIEWPFILEGVIASLVGSVLAVAGLWVTVRYFIEDWFASAVKWLPIVSTGNVWRITPALVVGAILVSALASWIALRRYARV